MSLKIGDEFYIGVGKEFAYKILADSENPDRFIVKYLPTNEVFIQSKYDLNVLLKINRLIILPKFKKKWLDFPNKV